ncbi:MAG: hypothetical protein KKD18_01150 [Nanoarchaeota archaeon]|nr:hypothetical protein [Nanoarchaeota archaeon]
MEREEYTPSRFRVKLNLYRGMIIGAVAPTVALRYTFFRNMPSWQAWTMAIFGNCFPVLPVAGAAVGFAEGYLGLRDLCKDKNRKLAEQRKSEGMLESLQEK